MIRVLAFTSVLAACSYDATLGFRPSANSNAADAAQPVVDVAPSPDAPANFAFDYGGDVSGPILYDGSYIYAILNQSQTPAPEALVRFDPVSKNRIDLPYVPVTAMAQDASTIYALVLGSASGLFDLVAISKSSTPTTVPDGFPDAAPYFVTTTLQHDLPDAAAIAVDADAVYVVQSGGAGGKLIRMDRTGANATTLLTTAGLSAVVVDSSFAYVVEHVPHGRLLAVPKTGGTALVLATQLVQPLDIDLAGGAVYITEQGDASTGGAIGRVAAPAAGAHQADVAAFARIVSGAHTPVDLTHDDTYVYWTADRDGLMRVPLAGGTPELRMPTAAAGNSAVTIQDDYVLFASPFDNGASAVHAVLR